MALIAGLVLFGACDGRRVTASDDGSLAQSCPCDPKAAAHRCAGNAVETCVAGSWQLTQACSALQVCAVGQCLDLGGTGCPDEARYDGNQTVRERYAPVRVSDCISVGGLGREVRYHENQSEVRQRALLFVDLRGCDTPYSDFTQPGGFSAIFGVDITSSASTASSGEEPSILVPPNQHAAVYRQTTRVERVAVLSRQGRYVGLAVLTDWIFRPDVAVGPNCIPESNLPPAVQLPGCQHQSDGCLPCR